MGYSEEVVITDDRFSAKALSRRVFYKWLFPALMEWVAIIALFWIGFTAHVWPVWVIVIFLLGSRQHALGVLGHDGSHFTAAKSKRINDVASALLCFWPMMTTLGDFRRFHYNHHRYFNSEHDPEVIFKSTMSGKQWQPPISRRRIAMYFIGDLFGFGILEVLKARQVLTMSGPLFKNAPGRITKGRWKNWIGPLATLAVIAGILYSFHLLIALAIWYAALLTSFWAFFRLRTWTEHGGIIENGETTHRIRLSLLERILITPHESWSHFEHHAHPGIPFWSRHKICEKGVRTKSLWQTFGSFGG
jgi:fatty acid desaturase